MLSPWLGQHFNDYITRFLLQFHWQRLCCLVFSFNNLCLQKSNKRRYTFAFNGAWTEHHSQKLQSHNSGRRGGMLWRLMHGKAFTCTDIGSQQFDPVYLLGLITYSSYWNIGLDFLRRRELEGPGWFISALQVLAHCIVSSRHLRMIRLHRNTCKCA